MTRLRWIPLLAACAGAVVVGCGIPEGEDLSGTSQEALQSYVLAHTLYIDDAWEGKESARIQVYPEALTDKDGEQLWYTIHRTIKTKDPALVEILDNPIN